MRLVSTTNPRQRATFVQAILEGIAPDGGRYVPEPLPCFRDVSALLDMDCQTRSVEILLRFLGEEFSRDDVESIVAKVFDIPTPLVRISSGMFALELGHGPSGSSKDFGARFLAAMLEQIQRRDPGLRTVLAATAGDTGGALAQALHGLKGFRVALLYPEGRVSPVQERLMMPGGNILAYAVEGDFEACQRMVDACVADRELARSIGLVPAGGANIARVLGLVPIWYELAAQLQALDLREAPVVSIPSGTGTTLCSGVLAWKTGLPIKAFVAASNANRALCDALEGQRRDSERPVIPTLSNAMDVAYASDWARIQKLFEDRPERLRTQIRWGSLDDAKTRQAMWELSAAGYTPEPHTAVGYGVLRERIGLKEPGVFLATAHPAKFREQLERDMNLHAPVSPALEATLANCLDPSIHRKSLPADPQALRAALLD